MAGGSFQSIISHSFPDGLSEPCIAVILKDTLNALSYLHSQGHLHRDIKAGNILVDSNGSVKLADFGVSASIYESLMSSSSGAASSSSSSSLMLKDVAGTPYWMAPEVIHSHVGYSYKADIWSFGITALELAHGRPPLSHLPPSKSMVLKITKRFRFSDLNKFGNGHSKKFSKAFKDMVASCLDQDPSKRPTAEKLLKHPFFRNCKGSEFLVKNVLQGLPSVEKRYKEISKVLHATPNEDDEEDDQEDDPTKQNLKQRRISGWNFNEDGLKLEPVFPCDHQSQDDEAILKEVRFGCETVIQEKGESEKHGVVAGSGTTGEQKPSGADVDVAESLKGVQGTEGVGKIGGGVEVGGGVLMNLNNRDAMLATLNVLKGSLEQELGQVKLLMKMIQGEEIHVADSEEQMAQEISKLRAELENERKKNKHLESQLDTLKLQLSSGGLNTSEI